MDAIAFSESEDGSSFWQQDGWQPADGDEDLQLQEIPTWDHPHGSLSIQASGEDDSTACHEYNSYGYGYGYGDPHGYGSGDWGSDIPDPASAPQRHSQKRKSDNISADGFYPPSSPSRSMAGSPLHSKGQGRNGNGSGSGTGSLFFKTKLCIKFRAGTCPYNSNCNFAHGMEELRKPPPGWEEIVGAQEGGGGVNCSSSSSGRNNNIKENAAGQLVLSSSDSQRFRRSRRCKKYYSEEGCPYGDRCNFLHDDQAKARESNAISLGPSTTSPANGASSGGGGGGSGSNAGGSGERPSNWKTRMCNKWEMTGHCPFGQKCNFAHGLAELQMYSGSTIDSDGTTISSNGLPNDGKQLNRSTSKPDIAASHLPTAYGSDGHSAGTALRHRSTYSSSSKSQKQVKLLENWKGPADEISTIYGDWIEEDE